MLAPLLQGQLDYLLFVSGLSFVLLAVTCANLRRQPAQRLPWAWLGLFGVTQGLHEWLEVLALSTGDGPAFAAIRTGIIALSFLCLLEFGRSGGRKLGGKDPGVWIYLPLVLAAAIGGTAGVPGLNAAARYAFGLVGGIWAVITLSRAAQTASETRGVLRIMALLMAGYALAAAAFVPPAPFFPASTINPAAFQALTGIPLQLIRAALALFLAAVLWDYYAQRLAKPLRADRRQHGLQFTAAMASILIAGWFFTNAVENKTVRREREDILVQTTLVAAAINVDQLEHLTASKADMAHPDFTRLREQLVSMARTNPRIRDLYLMFLREGRIVFVVDSAAEDSSDYVGPGVPYEKPPPALFTVFATGRAATVGPYTDEYGTFLSGFAALRQPAGRLIIAVMGLDVAASDLQRAIAQQRSPPIIITLLITMLFVGFVVVRQRIEEAAWQVETSERSLAEAQEVAHVGSWTLDARTGQLVWSEEMFRIFGGDPRQPAPAYPGWQRHVHPEDWPLLDRSVQHALQTGASFEVESRVIRPDGAIRHLVVKAKVWRGSKDKIARLLGTAQDITVRKETEDKLRKLSRAIEQSTATVIVTDRRGRIEYVNPHFSHLTGYSFEEVSGQNPRILKSGLHPPEFFKQLWDQILAGKDWHGDLFNKKKNGENYWESASISPIKNDAGEITHFVVVKEDITERKRVAAELQRAKEAAEAATQAKSTFLANMSHEIRTPMNAILGFSQLMQRDPALTLGQKHHLGTISRSGEHLLALINDILEMSRIEAGRVALNPANFDLHTIMDDLERLFRIRTDAKNLQFTLERIGQVPQFVLGDEGKLRQILINLLGNAVKFTERGGVALRVRAQPGKSDGFRLQAEIEDTGPGMSAEELERLFQHFEQTSTGRKSGVGTGLGLAISRQLARLMGGDITVRSQVGKGSIFRLEIELMAGAAKTAEPRNAERQVLRLGPRQPTWRVLIADDNQDNRELLAQLLGPIGFETRSVEDGEQAVREFQAWRPHLLLIDMRMPGTDGGEAMRRIRSSPGGGDVKIIMVSASVFAEDRDVALAHGANAFLRKPFREAALFELIRQHLPVEYVYRDKARTEGSAQPAGRQDAVSEEALARLPEKLRVAMREATVNGDTVRLNQLLQQVAVGDAGLAQSLRQLADRYDHDTLTRLLTPKEP